MDNYDKNMVIKRQEVLRAKIVILYILDYFAVPLTKEQFVDFVSAEELINYFDLQTYTDDLMKVGHIELSESEGKNYLLITDSGKDTVELFLSEINQPLRRRLNDAIDEKKKSFNIKTNIMAEYVKLDENEYNVQLTINEGAYRLMYIDLNVLTNKDAKKICENWRNNARYMYGDLLHLLTKNNGENQVNDNNKEE